MDFSICAHKSVFANSVTYILLATGHILKNPFYLDIVYWDDQYLCEPLYVCYVIFVAKLS